MIKGALLHIGVSHHKESNIDYNIDLYGSASLLDDEDLGFGDLLGEEE